MADTVLVNSGVTEKTPENIYLGAGTIHNGLKCTNGVWNFAESLLGATSGGSTLKITPELLDLGQEIDGVLVFTEGLVDKVGEKATLETNIIEITPDIIKKAIFAEEKSGSDATGYTELVSKKSIAAGDYFENFGYVGKTLKGKPIIIIFDKALCTSGLEFGGEKKKGTVIKLTIECSQKITGDLGKLPYHIYYPTPAAAANTQQQ